MHRLNVKILCAAVILAIPSIVSAQGGPAWEENVATIDASAGAAAGSGDQCANKALKCAGTATYVPAVNYCETNDDDEIEDPDNPSKMGVCDDAKRDCESKFKKKCTGNCEFDPNSVKCEECNLGSGMPPTKCLINCNASCREKDSGGWGGTPPGPEQTCPSPLKRASKSIDTHDIFCNKEECDRGFEKCKRAGENLCPNGVEFASPISCDYVHNTFDTDQCKVDCKICCKP